jgi:CRP-like cAMP-binding protein
MRRPSASPDPNRLLAALARPGYERLAKHIEVVPLTFGQVLHEPGQRFGHVYFPRRGVVSLLTTVGGGKGAEVGIVGNEGLVGGSAALGVDVSNLRAVVQGGGSAARISTRRLRLALSTHAEWYRELFRFTYALMGQVAQTAACNRFHRVEQRLARWLLSTRDRVQSDNFHLTHQFLSLMLGVRRTGVTVAAANLQKRGLITYTRGNIQLLDWSGLEAAACACYGVVSDTYRRTLRT